MKTVTARALQKKVKECVDWSQEDRIVITRHGKPAAVMVGEPMGSGLYFCCFAVWEQFRGQAVRVMLE